MVKWLLERTFSIGCLKNINIGCAYKSETRHSLHVGKSDAKFANPITKSKLILTPTLTLTNFNPTHPNNHTTLNPTKPNYNGQGLKTHLGCVQLRRLPARRLCRRPHGMAPVAGECTERTVRIDVNMNVIN